MVKACLEKTEKKNEPKECFRGWHYILFHWDTDFLNWHYKQKMNQSITIFFYLKHQYFQKDKIPVQTGF